MTEYELNTNIMPTSVNNYLIHAKQWREKCKVPNFVYEYHFWWPQYRDFGVFGMAEIIHKDVKGYKATMCSEKGIAKAAAKLTYAFANATVPKVNVIIGKALGTAAIAMNSKALGADITIAWPTAQVGTMEGKLAAKIMYEGQGADVINEKAAEYEALQLSAGSAARRGYVDQIVEAADTRKYVIGAFEMLFTKSEDRPYKKHGTV